MGSNLEGADRETLSWFADEESAQRYFEKMRWPDGICCPRCASRERIGKLNGSTTRLGAYKCYACRKIFSITHGTMFSGSHVPVHKWLQAICLTEGGTRPMRPHHLQQILNVSFKTASSMVRRLAEAAAAGCDVVPSEPRATAAPLHKHITAKSVANAETRPQLGSPRPAKSRPLPAIPKSTGFALRLTSTIAPRDTRLTAGRSAASEALARQVERDRAVAARGDLYHGRVR